MRWTHAEEPTTTRTDAPLALADLLRVPPGEPLFTYDALQTADQGRLRQLHRTYIPFSVLLDTKYEEQPPPPAPHLYNALAKLGHDFHFTEYVHTRMPLPDQAQALRLTDGVPTLNILRVTHSHGQAASHGGVPSSRARLGACVPALASHQGTANGSDFPYFIKDQGGSLRSPHATRPRPGLRTTLRPTPARPASMPRAQQTAA
ncbi:UTRA domain-containing protein [Streptomyces sp. NPDC057620]|uniref:UTRA domain-containing protein n=1 Tax=Streptomyces sp. NPDC057620 TaxID=3346185 RepID=UPI003696CA1A